MRGRVLNELGPIPFPRGSTAPYLDPSVATRVATRSIVQDTAEPAAWAHTNRYSSMLDSIDPITNKRSRYRPVEHIKRIGKSNIVTLRYGCSTPWPQYYGQVDLTLSPFLQTPPLATFEWDTAVVQLADQVQREVQTDFMGFVFLAEARKTINMIRNPFSIFSPRKMRAVKNLAGYSFAALQKAGNTLLEWRYGWKPLFSDVEAFSKLLASYGINNLIRSRQYLVEQFSAEIDGNFVSSPPTYLYPTGQSLSRWNSYSADTQPWSIVSGNNGLAIRQKLVKLTCKGRVTCERIRTELKPIDHLQQLLDVLQVGNWRQICDSMWELLPFSFVADWVINLDSLWRPRADVILSARNVANLGFSTSVKLEYDAEGIAINPCYWLTTVPGFIGIQPYSITDGRRGPFAIGAAGSISHYTRSVGMPPNGQAVFQSKGITTINTLTGLSLALQKIALAYKR